VDAYSWTWLGLGVAATVTETLAISRRDWAGTLSENIQRLFHIDKPKGKLVFAILWLSFAGWFFGHILKMWP
jgi:hypothetical protein